MKPTFNHDISCFCVCELRNLTTVPLAFERRFFAYSCSRLLAYSCSRDCP